MFANGNEQHGGVGVDDSRRRQMRFAALALAAVAIAAVLLWPVVDIELRLWRNGAIADRLAASLHSRFPAVGFRGAASYKDEVVYIVVFDHVDGPTRGEIERWLRAEKAERKIAPEIRLRFAGDSLDDIRIGG